MFVQKHKTIIIHILYYLFTISTSRNNIVSSHVLLKVLSRKDTVEIEKEEETRTPSRRILNLVITWGPRLISVHKRTAIEDMAE